jgi:hypothetical protein
VSDPKRDMDEPVNLPNDPVAVLRALLDTPPPQRETAESEEPQADDGR